MKTFEIHYRGQFLDIVKAKNEVQALEKAKKMFSEPKLGWEAFKFIPQL